ncbi:MAG: dynamin family protein [Clostridia bacterium]|nr:dynamin family protein [Clostridia bacterium]
MAEKIVKTDFFKNRKKVSKPSEKPAETVKVNENKPGAHSVRPVKHSLEIEGKVRDVVEKAKAVLEKTGQSTYVSEIERIVQDAKSERFTVSVVGEFSKGKSTFVNSLMGREILPVGDLPTTAMLTRIRYNEAEIMVHFDKTGKKVGTYPVGDKSWAGLVAENFGAPDPTGTVIVGLNDPWLKDMGLEINDTPGAGDLEDDRAAVIGDALTRSDGAIITISALAALSMSEKLFIEQRLIAKKTPFLMLIITKLDQVPLKQRKSVVDFVINRLKLWNMNIPVFVPYQVEMTDDTYKNIFGMDKVKSCIEKWMRDEERVSLTNNWIISKTETVIQRAIATVNEELEIVSSDEKKRDELIEEKKDKLKSAHLAWEDLRLQLLARSNECYDQLMTRFGECVTTAKERLQYEASHTANPEKWWREDYPYRVKVELSNAATSVENTLGRIIGEDARWFNANLEKNFKTQVAVKRETVMDKNAFSDVKPVSDMKFENLDKKRTAAKIGSTALSIGGSIALNCLGLGVIGVVATLGLGTGSSLISENVFKSKLESQRETLKSVVGSHVEKLANDSIIESEKKVKIIYSDILKEAEKAEKAWLKAQGEAIERSVKKPDANTTSTLKANLNELEKIAYELLKI